MGSHSVSCYLCAHDTIAEGEDSALVLQDIASLYFCLLNHQWQQVLLLQYSFSPYLTNISEQVSGGEYLMVPVRS